MIPETKTLLNAEEVAAMLGISERTLWRLRSAGKVPEPVRFGRCTRWHLADVSPDYSNRDQQRAPD